MKVAEGLASLLVLSSMIIGGVTMVIYPIWAALQGMYLKAICAFLIPLTGLFFAIQDWIL